jgi:hypothetical protein
MSSRAQLRALGVAVLSVAAIFSVHAATTQARALDTSNLLIRCTYVSPETGETELYPPGATRIVVLNGFPLTMLCGHDGQWHLDARRGSPLPPAVVPQSGTVTAP